MVPERERQRLRNSEDDDGDNHSSRWVGGVGADIERTKISLASDSACRYQPWLPFLPAESGNVVKTYGIPASEAGQGSRTVKYSQMKSLLVLSFVSLNNFLNFIHFCFIETSNVKKNNKNKQTKILAG